MFSLLLLFGLVSNSELGYGTHETKLFYHAPPDPVNIRTLNFFFPVDEHLVLPCVMPIEIKIAYNSYSGDVSIFGEKWTFNHNIRVNKGTNRLEIMEGDGFLNAYTKERNLELNKSSQIEQILVAQKKLDVQGGGLKSDQAYEELKRRLTTDESYREEQANKLLSGARPITPGIYYSFARGPSTLELKADGTYVRKFQNGSAEIFNKDGRLTRTEDRNANYLTYAYSGTNLTRINDQCGRYVSIFYQDDPALKNFIQKMQDSLGRTITYTFTGRRLTSYIDASARKMEFEYDKQGNITRLKSTKPKQAADVIELTYNDKFEITNQKGPGSKETRYKRTFVANNPNHSITEITKFENGKPAGRELHEFKVKEYETVTKFDAAGKEVGREVKTISPETGYPTSILDAQGNGDKFVYDPKTGNLLKREAVPSGQLMEFQYEDRCSQVKSMKISNRGKPVSEMKFKFDDKCNLKEAEETSNGKQNVFISLEYLKNGKLSFLRDKVEKKEIAFTYWTFGKPESITLRDTGTLLVKYSQTGEIEKVDTLPHGKAEARFKGKQKSEYQGVILTEVRSALDSMLNYLRPAGLNIGL